MKTRLYALLSGSIAYNTFMIFTSGEAHYGYTAGSMLVQLIIGYVWDKFDEKKKL